MRPFGDAAVSSGLKPAMMTNSRLRCTAATPEESSQCGRGWTEPAKEAPADKLLAETLFVVSVVDNIGFAAGG